jgi:hypothetical protein
MMNKFLALLTAAALLAPTMANAAPAYACGGAALAGGAQILCSHINPKAPLQSCNFSWALKTSENITSVVEGTFQLPPGTSNALVYQGFGFDLALANPIVVCVGN